MLNEYQLVAYEVFVISGKCKSVKLTVTYQVCGKQQVLRERAHVFLGVVSTSAGPLG